MWGWNSEEIKLKEQKKKIKKKRRHYKINNVIHITSR
jgi:hypothetical protein